MKQVTKKTLGVAVLGAALSAAGAGVASAADVTGPLETAGTMAGQGVQSSPLDSAAQQLPKGAPESMDPGQQAVGDAAGQIPSALGQVLPTQGLAQGQEKSAQGQAQGQGQGQNKGLLGGLPLNGLPLGG